MMAMNNYKNFFKETPMTSMDRVDLVRFYQALLDQYLPAKIAVDTDESEPSKTFVKNIYKQRSASLGAVVGAERGRPSRNILESLRSIFDF